MPWAGFKAVDPSDIEKASAQSKTIAMQRKVVWGYDTKHFDIVEESALVELAPDRGTKEFVAELNKLVARACELEATILYVDFGAAIQQRSHQYLQEFVGDHENLFLSIWPAPEDEEWFREHFGSWRDEQSKWTKGKQKRVEAAVARAKELIAEGASLKSAAAVLEGEGLRSATGKVWTADSLRQSLKVNS
ncbi:hypothetical protein B2G71_23045 [Novosphingobium sp. PC22D]|nr:hypothetical protein B2G71_23045 [Novosphingobium sp. PC22D]